MGSALLAQTFPTVPPADFIKDHSTMVAWVLGLLFLTVIAQATGLIAWVHREFASLKTADAAMGKILAEEVAKASAAWERASQDRVERVMGHIGRSESRVARVEDRVSILERLVEVTKEHVGAGDAALSRIAAAQEKLAEGMERMQEENSDAHAQIIEGRQQLIGRISAVEAQTKILVDSTPMMSGKELKTLVATLSTIVTRMENGK